MFTSIIGAEAKNKLNKGFSLVELLVTIAIMSILTGMAGVSIALAFSRDAEKCAKEIDTTLEHARMYAMSKTDENNFELGKIWLSPSKGERMTALVHEEHSVSDCASGEGRADSDNAKLDYVKELQSRVIVSIDGSADEVGSVTVTFDKTTGKVKQVLVDGTEFTGDILKINCTSDSGNKSASVVLIMNTGRHYVEYN